MAKLIAGITGWGRGAVAGVQMQTMRGKTFLRAKQPPLGPGTAAQQAYREKFSFIQHQMKLPDEQGMPSEEYLSSVELLDRTAVLKQILGGMPWESTAKMLPVFDNYLWKNVELGLYMDEGGQFYVQMWTQEAVPGDVVYNWTLDYKYASGTYGHRSGSVSPEGLLAVYFDDYSYNDVFPITSILIRVWRNYPASSRPYLAAAGVIYGPDFSSIVKGSFTLKSTKYVP